MKIINIFKINNWGIRNFITIIAIIQIFILGLIAMDLMGINIPFLRQIIGFIYITFIPGFLILRVLRLHDLSNIETLLFSVGLSITTVMLIGFFINFFYSIYKISNPISLLPLIIGLSVFVIIMSILSYITDKDYGNLDYIEFDISPQTLLLIIIPLISILGSIYSYYYNNSIISFIMIIIIALIVLLIGFKKFISPKFYPLAIFVISISLLYHTWLLSPYLFGRDIFSEYAISNFVFNQSYWNVNGLPQFSNFLYPNSNAMLILSLFPPITAIIGNINLINVYKIIFPLIISLTPLGLYEIYKTGVNKQIAFLAVFLFIFMGFYNVILVSVKQSIAIFFIVLLVLCLLKKNNLNIAILSVLFLFSIVTSHYGTTYLFMFILFFALVISILFKNMKFNKVFIKSKFLKSVNEYNRISYTLVILFFTMAIAWYIFLSQSSNLHTILLIGNNIYTSIFIDFFNPQTTGGLGLVLTSPQTIDGYLNKGILLIIQFFIFLGILLLFFKDKIKFNAEFVFMIIPAFLLDILSVLTPNFSIALSTQRLYSLTLIFLAPMALIGGIYFFDKIKIFISSWKFEYNIKIMSILLITLFLLQVGAIKVILNEPGTSIPLSKEQMINSNNITAKSEFYYDYGAFEQNYYSINWLTTYKNNATIFSDESSSKALQTYNINLMLNWQPYSPSNNNQGGTYQSGDYLYLSYSNIIGNVWVKVIPNNLAAYEFQNISPSFNKTNKIYSNGASEVYQFQ